MRTRRWILVIALFVVFSSLIIYHSWNVFQVNDRIKNYVLNELKLALGKHCKIEKLSMTLGAVHFKNVEINAKDEGWTLTVDDIRIGLNLSNLIKNGLQPQKILHDILIIRPHVTIKAIPQSGMKEHSTDTVLITMLPNQYWEKIRDFDFIKRITISKGKISYLDSTQQKFLLAHDLNGWLVSRQEGYVSTRLVGKLFQSEKYNLFIDGNIDLIQSHLDSLNIKVKGYNWKEKVPFLIPEYFDIKKGTIDGTITVSSQKSSARQLDIHGEVIVREGSIEIPEPHLFVDKINIIALIDNYDCRFENSGFLLNGSPVVLFGKIINLRAPKLELALSSQPFDLKKNLSYMAPNSPLKIKGYSNLSFLISNTFENPDITGEITCPEIVLYNKTFRQCKATVSLHDSIFRINDFSSELEGLTVAGHSQLNFSQEKDSVFFCINGNGIILPDLIPIPFHLRDGTNTQFQIQGTGSFAQLAGSIDVGLKILSSPDTTLRFKGNFELSNRKLALHLNCPAHRFVGDGSINLSDQHPKFHINLMNVHNLIYSLPGLQLFQGLLNYKTSYFQIQGESSSWRVTGTYTWTGNNEENPRLANLTCSIKSNNNIRQIMANINISSAGEKFYSNLNVVQTPEQIEIKNFEIENIFYGRGSLQLTNDQPIQVNIIFPEVSLSKLESLIISNNKSVDQGKLSGFITISGTLTDLKITGKLNFNGVVLNDIGFYNSEVTFQLINDRFVVNELNINRNGQPIFKCDGTYFLNSDQLHYHFIGQDIDLNSFVTTFLNKPEVLTGNGRVDLQLYGKASCPQFNGRVDLENGKLGPFSFTHMLFDLGPGNLKDSTDSYWEADSLTEGGVIFQDIVITRDGQFEMQGKGVIPFSSTQPLDIKLLGNGNILSLLPELTSFFKETKSDGDWAIHFMGSLNDVTISSGKLELSDGYLKLGDVAPEINNIAASMELEQDGFLNVKFISGKIKGKPFTFRNFRSLLDSSLKSFSIPELGLDLGAVTLETSSGGVPLHIPGLMEKGEVGQFIFSGKTLHDRFTFAGPLEHPMVRGKIQLHNGNFTFPFITSNATDTTAGPVVEFLKSIDWSVTALAGKDLHYQRQIPSGVDNVYVDLIIDAGVGGLHFNGIINQNRFGVVGALESSRGAVEYLDLDFQVIKAGMEFDMDGSRASDVEFDKSTLLPLVYGEARTTVTDSTGFPYYINMTLLTIDKETGHTLKKGRFGDMVFQLSTDNPNVGNSEGEILASLGYSVSNIHKVATDIIGISADNLVFRPLFRPFERQLERSLKLDMVRFSSRFTRNLIEMNLKDERNFLLNSKLFLLRSTKLMIGKYLADRLFLTYTGQLEAGMDYRYQQEGFGFRHTLGLEYRINPSLLLQMEYDYDSLLLWQKEDKKIMIRHSFPF